MLLPPLEFDVGSTCMIERNDTCRYEQVTSNKFTLYRFVEQKLLVFTNTLLF